MTRLISTKVTHLLHMHNLKVLSSSETKLNRILRLTSAPTEDMKLDWNPKKCMVIHVMGEHRSNT